MNDHHTITHAPIKAGSALLAGLTFSDWASILAIIYTLILIGEWVYKRFIKKKPFNEPLDTGKGEP